MQYFSCYNWFSAWFQEFSCIKNYLKKFLKKLRNIQAWYSHKGIYLRSSTYEQDMREIPAIDNEKIVIKCFHT